MRAVIQRVSEAEVVVDHQVVGKIDTGLLILLGITDSDDENDIDWLTSKILNLRIFNDSSGKMNLSIKDIDGQILVISQFTLFASTKKGNRPSFTRSAKPNIAISLYEKFIQSFTEKGYTPEEGIFGADMKVSLINDGPVTITIDTKERE